MTAIKTILSSFCIFIYFAVNAQTTSSPADSTLLKLSITTFEDKKISAKVYFENTATHKKISVRTDKNGKLEHKFRIGANYNITIGNSEDSYEYTIPDADGFPLSFTFKYNLKQNIKATCVVRFFNHKNLKNVSLESKSNPPLIAGIINDTANFLLEFDEDYTVQIEGVELKNNRIKFTRGSFTALSYVMYFTDEKHGELIQVDSLKSVINVVYKNLHDDPVKGETIVIKGRKRNSQFRVITAANGSAIAILPSNDFYTVSIKHFPDVFTMDTEAENDIVIANNLLLSYPGSKEFEKQKLEEARRVTVRDSVYLLYDKIKELSYNGLRSDLSAKAPTVKAALLKDPKYFEKENNVVCAVLNRNKWKEKTIVTDVTGSMYPYMREVALWHSLEFMDRSGSDYVFFNDGDNKPDNQKTIGATGGIYTCLKTSPDSVIKIMYTAMQNGGGGDGPENDIEALIEAEKISPANGALILIADNLSAVKDKVLMSQIKVPVRVVLCGSRAVWVHPDYLELAFKTGGSIHTIEEDIFNLASLHNGETIKIGNTVYKFEGGHFFPFDIKL